MQGRWPRRLLIVRHGESTGNVARQAAMDDSVDPGSPDRDCALGQPTGRCRLPPGIGSHGMAHPPDRPAVRARECTENACHFTRPIIVLFAALLSSLHELDYLHQVSTLLCLRAFRRFVRLSRALPQSYR